MKENAGSIHKEFELERLVLFSDAVFAIAITLLIIEIKFPDIPQNLHGTKLFALFIPTIIEFVTFIISFVIVGSYWIQHLQLCKYLKAYDNRVIIYNLLFLFFVVTFPFTAAGIGHFTPAFQMPMQLYMLNFLMLCYTYYLFANYVVNKRPELTIPGHKAEKTYLVMKGKLPAMMIVSSLIIVVAVFFLTADNSMARVYSYQSLAVFAIIMQWRLRKYKPKKPEKNN